MGACRARGTAAGAVAVTAGLNNEPSSEFFVPPSLDAGPPPRACACVSIVYRLQVPLGRRSNLADLRGTGFLGLELAASGGVNWAAVATNGGLLTGNSGIIVCRFLFVRRVSSCVCWWLELTGGKVRVPTGERAESWATRSQSLSGAPPWTRALPSWRPRLTRSAAAAWLRASVFLRQANPVADQQLHAARCGLRCGLHARLPCAGTWSPLASRASPAGP